MVEPGLNGDLFCSFLCIFDLCIFRFVLGLGLCFSFFLLTAGLGRTSAVFLLRSKDVIFYCLLFYIAHGIGLNSDRTLQTGTDT